MKAERDRREVAIIEYDGKLFDYDDKARERMRIAKEDLENNGLLLVRGLVPMTVSHWFTLRTLKQSIV